MVTSIWSSLPVRVNSKETFQYEAPYSIRKSILTEKLSQKTEFRHFCHLFISKFPLNLVNLISHTPQPKSCIFNRQRCFVEQYGNFSFPVLEQIAGYEGPTNVSGTQTLGENIAGMS